MKQSLHFDIRNKTKELLSTMMHHCKDESHRSKQSLQSPKPSIHDKRIILAFIGYDQDFTDHLDRLENEINIQTTQIEFNQFLEFIVQLVELFKHTVILSELQFEHDWHENLYHQLKSNRGITGNSFLNHKIEKIALTKGLTKDQWNRLLYISSITKSNTEINKTSKKHLQHVYDMATRLLENDQQIRIHALIHAIEKYMPEKYLTEN